MTSLLEKMINEDINWLTNSLLESGKKIKEQMDGILVSFNLFIETGDSAYLHKELDKKKDCKENFSQVTTKTSRSKKGVLAEIAAPNGPVNAIDVKIKTEKISDAFLSIQNNLTQVSQVSSECTLNSNEEMPPPTQLLPRKRKIKKEPLDCPKRSTRTRKKPVRYTCDEVSTDKESDIIMENQTLVTVDITNDVDKETEIAESSNIQMKQDESARSKRTKTIKKTDPQADVNKVVDNMESIQTLQHANNLNATFTTNSNSHLLNNCTVVLEQLNFNEKVEVINKQTPQKQKKNQKEIFSPFDKVSTKKKVAAFEKLNAYSKTTPPVCEKDVDKKPTKDEKKFATPLASRMLTKTMSTTKINKYSHRENPSSDTNSSISSKSQSALKASQAEFRERLKKKEEKEQEALRKREALLLAMTEERKKKREEKQLKAQQQREMLEKEKLKLTEMQKLKEDKYKQTLAEKEEKGQKQKEEAKKRAEEIKLRERNLKLQIGRPIYMTTPAPLLPTDDCYDSDEEESGRVQQMAIPSWSTDRELRKMQYIMLKAGETIKNTFFCRQTYTPDLQEIFEQIDPRKLKRTSSAVWKKPPRYTLFLESSTVQFSEDDEN